MLRVTFPAAATQFSHPTCKVTTLLGRRVFQHQLVQDWSAAVGQWTVVVQRLRASGLHFLVGPTQPQVGVFAARIFSRILSSRHCLYGDAFVHDDAGAKYGHEITPLGQLNEPHDVSRRLFFATVQGREHKPKKRS